MQVFKRIASHCERFVVANRKVCPPKQSRWWAQNLVEFVFVLPILLFMTLAIFETALFWQDVNSIYNLNAEINANAALADTSNMVMGSECTAATKALEILEKKDATIALSHAVYTKEIVPLAGGAPGSEPFALYKFSANPITVTTQEGTGLIHSANTVTRPKIAMWVDCRSPFEKGIKTQIEFYHKTIIMSATIPAIGDVGPIVVIPNNIFIASPKLNTLRHY